MELLFFVDAQVWKMSSLHEADSGQAHATPLRHLWRDVKRSSELQHSSV